jgi:hypothetical protein
VIAIVEGLIAGFEAGFPVPVVAQDKIWMKMNLLAFRKKASEGDVEFQEMVRELETRGGFRNVVNGESVHGMCCVVTMNTRNW